MELMGMGGKIHETSATSADVVRAAQRPGTVSGRSASGEKRSHIACVPAAQHIVNPPTGGYRAGMSWRPLSGLRLPAKPEWGRTRIDRAYRVAQCVPRLVGRPRKNPAKQPTADKVVHGGFGPRAIAA